MSRITHNMYVTIVRLLRWMNSYAKYMNYDK